MQVGEKYPNVQKFKQGLTFYALANGFSIWFERSASKYVLGIILSVTTVSEEVTTARRLYLQWKLITTARTNITTAYLITVRETRLDKHRKDFVYILFY